MWQPWEDPITADQCSIELLRPLLVAEDKITAYARVWEIYEQGIRTTDEVVVISPEKLKVISSRDYYFVTAQTNRTWWGFHPFPLVDPNTLANLVDGLKSLTSPRHPTAEYRLYFDGTRVAIVREEIVEPEPAAEPETPATKVIIQTCPAGGQHLLDGITSIQNTGGRTPRQVQACKNCGAMVDLRYTKTYTEA